MSCEDPTAPTRQVGHGGDVVSVTNLHHTSSIGLLSVVDLLLLASSPRLMQCFIHQRGVEHIVAAHILSQQWGNNGPRTHRFYSTIFGGKYR